jgi:hypothetical protein
VEEKVPGLFSEAENKPGTFSNPAPFPEKINPAPFPMSCSRLLVRS